MPSQPYPRRRSERKAEGGDRGDEGGPEALLSRQMAAAQLAGPAQSPRIPRREPHDFAGRGVDVRHARGNVRSLVESSNERERAFLRP